MPHSLLLHLPFTVPFPVCFPPVTLFCRVNFGINSAPPTCPRAGHGHTRAHTHAQLSFPMLHPTRVLYASATAELPAADEDSASASEYGNLVPTLACSTGGGGAQTDTKAVDFFAGKPESYQYGTILRPSPHLATTAMKTIYANEAQDATATSVPPPPLTSSTHPMNRTQDTCVELESEAHHRAVRDVAWRRLRGDVCTTLEADARQAYRLKLLSIARLDMLRAETNTRRDLEEDLLGQLQGFYELCDTGAAHGARRCHDMGGPLAHLECRLSARQTAVDALQQRREDALREEGRLAWQETVQLQKQSAEAEAGRATANKRQDDGFRAATVFLVVEERKQRDALDVAAEEAYNALLTGEVAGRQEAARLACERFMNTPEQLAMTATLQRRVNRLRKRWAKHDAEQKSFLEDCHHGTGGQSVFVGQHARKICTRCRVRFDDGLGFYVRMDQPPPLALPSLQRAVEELDAPRYPPEWSVAGATAANTEDKSGTRKKGSAKGSRKMDSGLPGVRSTSANGVSGSKNLPAVAPPKRQVSSGGAVPRTGKKAR